MPSKPVTFSQSQGDQRYARLTSDNVLTGSLEIDGTINHDGPSVGLYGAAPVAQAAAIADPTAPGVVYAQAEAQSLRNALLAARNALRSIGIIAT
jgi:hypothetical protein